MSPPPRPWPLRPARRAVSGREETRSLDELYRDALAEGGKLVVYAGGDLADPGSGAGARTAFRQRFPEIDLRLIVDYSKFHDARVDDQPATGMCGRCVPGRSERSRRGL